VLRRFAERLAQRDLASISQEEVLEFLLTMTKDYRQATKRNWYSVLASFYNFIINTGLPALTNPCNSSVIRKIFKRPQAIQWQIVDKEAVDEIIFRTANTRNRLMLELMARGGMRVGEVLSLTPTGIQERSVAIQNSKSGRIGETVYVPRKILVRLTAYTKAKNICCKDRIFPISYVAAWSMVKMAGKMVNIELRPHDLRRHAATYASRSGTPIEIVSKVILRHADLSTTQRYLGKVNDTEAIRWIETLYGEACLNRRGRRLACLEQQ
jgi:site-specific recombinase XerD